MNTFSFSRPSLLVVCVAGLLAALPLQAQQGGPRNSPTPNSGVDYVAPPNTGLETPRLNLGDAPYTAPPATTPQPAAPRGGATLGRLLETDVPLSFTFKEIGSDWREIRLNPVASASLIGAANGDALLNEYVREALGTQESSYLTKWQTFNSGGETFLIAYRVPVFGEREFRAYVPATRPLSSDALVSGIKRWLGDQTLDLALLNMRSIKVLDTTRPFQLDVALNRIRSWYESSLSPVTAAAITKTTATTVPVVRAVAQTPAKSAAPKSVTSPRTQLSQQEMQTQSLKNLREVAAGILMWSMDSGIGDDVILPPMQDVAALKKAISPYIHNDSQWLQPGTNVSYKVNTILSGKKIAHISAPQDMVLLYEAQAGSDGKRSVAFLDGQARRLDANEWLKYKKGSKIK